MVVEEVTTKNRVVGRIRLRPEAMPFVASPDPVSASGAPRTASGAQEQH
jgi:hypothetical protein